jgi:diadenosine tetraphosphatase ApaH/serine/threonine PP2A family protein phosphatase
VHASADRPERWQYVQTAAAARECIDAAQTTWTFAGHVHEQILFFKTLAGKTAPFRPTPSSPVPVPSHRGWMAIAGSAGQPRDGNPAAAWALFDSAREEITFFRVAYDHLAAAEKIRCAGLPSSIAHRLENGF